MDALTTLLATIPSVTVVSNHDVPANFVTESTPVINVLDGDDEDGSPRIVGNIVEFDVGMTIAGYVTANEPSDLRALREALWLAVWRLVEPNYQLSDGSGGSITWNVEFGKTSRRLESGPGKPVAVFELPVVLRIKARTSDPAIAA